MKRVFRRMAVLSMLVLALFAAGTTAQAKVTNAPAYELVNVARAPKVKGKWIQKPRGVEFQLEDGTFVHDQWIRVGKKIYYMNRKAVRATGWIKYRTGTYYANSEGELQRGWQKIDNKVYYMKPNGKAAGGLHKIGNYTFYFSTANGVRQNGWVQIGEDMYYFAPASGKMRTSKWICTDGKYYYVDEKGRKLTSQWLTLGQKRYYLGADGARATGWYPVDGAGYYYFAQDGVLTDEPPVDEATVSSPLKLETYQRARNIVTKITTADMSREQKLRACFDYLITPIGQTTVFGDKIYGGIPRPLYTKMDWPEVYANDIFVNHRGSCYSLAAAFAYLAKACGYTEVYACNSTGHGWTEIDGLIYDPEQYRDTAQYKYYGTSYSQVPGYKRAISQNLPFMHIKI